MEVPPTITDMQQLLNSKLYSVFEDVEYTGNYFRVRHFGNHELEFNNQESNCLQTTTDPESLRLFQKVRTNYEQRLYSPSDGIKLVRKGGYAFLVDPSSVYKEMKGKFSETN
jgi:hypothetical protein